MRLWLFPLVMLPLLTSCSAEVPSDSMHGAASQPEVTLLSGKHTVVLHTSEGDIVAELDADKAPKAVTNFVLLARNGFYDRMTFHRVMPNFMIQGGDPRGDGSGGASVFGRPFETEITGMTLSRGAIAMANRGPDMNLSQFFIVQGQDGAPWLEGKHTVFGQVTSGMQTVDAIARVDRDENNKPRTPVTFSVEVQ